MLGEDLRNVEVDRGRASLRRGGVDVLDTVTDVHDRDLLCHRGSPGYVAIVEERRCNADAGIHAIDDSDVTRSVLRRDESCVHWNLEGQSAGYYQYHG